MDAETSARAVRSAREVAHAASALASEAAALARIYEGHGAGDAALDAASAAIRTARSAFALDELAREAIPAAEAIKGAIAALDAAEDAIRSTRAAVDAVLDLSPPGGSAASVG